MRREGAARNVAVGLFGSLAIHLALAGIAIWPGLQIARAGWGEARAGKAGAERVAQAAPLERPRAAAVPQPEGLAAATPTSRWEKPRLALPDAAAWFDHLWQSTVFAIAAGLLALAFRRNGAHVRYWLWFCASIKFLVPLAVLPAVARLAWAPAVSSRALLLVWACGFSAIALLRCRMWRRVQTAVRASTRFELSDVVLPSGVEVRAAPGLLEPGVVGWRSPVLLMPADIQAHLTPPQLTTIVAHELCHIRRHDNLTAAIHMWVEALFWFHPLVWLIGARLLAERERACDEHVLRTFGQPQFYAQAILNVCKRYVESPLVCVAGVGGSSIRRRIDAILRNEVGEALGPMKKVVLVMALAVAVIIPVGVDALHEQNAPQPADVTLDAAARAAVIDGALKALNDAYVFPETAKKMEEAIRARQQRNEYDAITSGRQFATILTEHLREVSHDLHLSVNMIPQGPPLSPPPAASGGQQTLEERQRTLAGRRNFGFVRVERLAGNVGYVDLRGFVSPSMAGETATAAMTFLSSTDAVIFDLRQNGGGDPNMVAFLTSYLLGPQAVHLNDFYSRPTNTTSQSWTMPYVPGRRLTNADVYILTSSRTFSGAEEFTYNLKHLKRATVVGETTGGGAHTVSGRRINAQFAIAVPDGRPINAVTKDNWEGVGVEPDVKVPAEQALNAAHVMALEQQQRRLTSDMPGLRTEITTTLPILRKELGPTAAAIPAAADVKAVPASQAGEDFESGTLASWRVDQRGSGGWFTYSNGKTAPDPARSESAAPFDVPDPPQGKFAAVADQNAPGRFILYRDVVLDGRYRLQMTVFYVNLGRFFSSATISSRNTIAEEQHYRIDIVAASAPVDSAAKDHVLATIFETKPGDPARRAPADVSVDLSAYEGQTVRLRLAVGENQSPLRAGVDNIRFERIQR